MNTAQVIFLIIIFALAVYLIRLRSLLFDRLLILVFLGLGIISIIIPEMTTFIANRIGIGRGTDLVFYLFILTSLFGFFYLISEINHLLRLITHLCREIAIINARFGGEEFKENRENIKD